MLKSLLTLLLIVYCFGAASGQQSKPPGFQRVDWALLAAHASVRALDVYSTHYALTHGEHEAILPNVIASNPPRMALYSASAVGFDWFVSRELIRHHHRKLARAFTIIDTAQVFGSTIGNLFPPPQSPRGPRKEIR